MATTNHPQKLDAAINNRPGRFDAVIEIGLPSRTMRQEYFRRQMPQFDQAQLEAFARRTEGLSFAHLREILLRSGYAAMQNGRTDRLIEDVVQALDALQCGHQVATGGFNPGTAGPFGFTEMLGRREL